LPVYQRAYSGDRYPRAPEHQHSIRSEQYRYQPREAVTRQHFEQRGNPENPGNPGNPGNWRGEPQRQAPVQQRPSAQQPPHDNGRRDKPGPHDWRREHEDEERGHGHR